MVEGEVEGEDLGQLQLQSHESMTSRSTLFVDLGGTDITTSAVHQMPEIQSASAIIQAPVEASDSHVDRLEFVSCSFS